MDAVQVRSMLSRLVEAHIARSAAANSTLLACSSSGPQLVLETRDLVNGEIKRFKVVVEEIVDTPTLPSSPELSALELGAAVRASGLAGP